MKTLSNKERPMYRYQVAEKKQLTKDRNKERKNIERKKKKELNEIKR